MLSQAIVLAAGQSSRFHPFGGKHHKSEISLLGKPIIIRTIDQLFMLGLKKVVVVIGVQHYPLQQLLKKHPQYQKSLKIVTQQKPHGMADAILTAKELLNNIFLVVNAHHFKLQAAVQALIQSQGQVSLLCQPTNQPQLYGIVTLDNQRVTSVVEKPQQPLKNPHRLLGVYLLNRDFLQFMESQPTAEHQLELSLHQFAQRNEVIATLFDQPLPTLKYPWHLLSCKNQLLETMEHHISPQATIADTALIKGKVYIETGALISDLAIVEGPAYIGRNAVVGQHCLVRKNSILEEGAEIQRYTEVANSLLLPGAHIHSGFIGDSIIGQGVRIGAGFVTANRRFDRQPISTLVKGKKTNTHLTKLGVIVGRQSQIGIQVGTYPGVIIDNHSLTMPGTMVKKNIYSTEY